MNEIQVYSSAEFGSIRTLDESGRPLFCGSDVAKALGYGNAPQAIKRHCRAISKRDTPIGGKVQAINFISEGDVYRLITHSKLPAAERFEQWVFDEVLPMIRNHGAYVESTLLDNILADPDYGIRLFTELKSERERRRALEQENIRNRQTIEGLQPKAVYYDLILQSKSLVPVSAIAKDYGMSAKAFNQLLHEAGVQFRIGETWLLYQHYANQGYTQSRTHVVDADKSVIHAYWTQRGRLFLYRFLKDKLEIIPVFEHAGANAQGVAL